MSENSEKAKKKKKKRRSYYEINVKSTNLVARFSHESTSLDASNNTLGNRSYHNRRHPKAREEERTDSPLAEEKEDTIAANSSKDVDKKENKVEEKKSKKEDKEKEGSSKRSLQLHVKREPTKEGAEDCINVHLCNEEHHTEASQLKQSKESTSQGDHQLTKSETSKARSKHQTQRPEPTESNLQTPKQKNGIRKSTSHIGKSETDKERNRKEMPPKGKAVTGTKAHSSKVQVAEPTPDDSEKSKPDPDDDLTAQIRTVYGSDMAGSQSSMGGRLQVQSPTSPLQHQLSTDIKAVFGCSVDRITSRTNDDEIRAVLGTSMRNIPEKNGEAARGSPNHLETESEGSYKVHDIVTNSGTMVEKPEPKSNQKKSNPSSSTKKPKR